MDVFQKIVSQQWFWMVCLFLVIGNMIFMHLGLMPLINPDEGRNASIAWEMHTTGNWLIPTYNGLPYMDKPAFFFKAVSLSLSWFGHNEFAARLPSALSATGLLLLVFAFCRKEYNLRIAVLALLIIATTPLFFAFARWVIFDMMLALAVCGAVFAGYQAEFQENEADRKKMNCLAAIAMGVAVLIKGPVGFILPVLILTVFFRVEGRKGAWKRLLSAQTWLILGLIILPWFIGASHLRPDFPYYGVVRESLMRFTTHELKRTGPFYYYLPVIALTFFPWSLLLPGAAWAVWRKRFTLSRTDRLLIVWTIVTVVFFSISQSKLPGYILTSAVASGVLVARLFAHAFDQQDVPKIMRYGLIAFLAILASALFGILVVHLHPDLINRIHFRSPDMQAGLQAAALNVAILLGLSFLVGMAALALNNSRLIFAGFLTPFILLPVLFLPAYAMMEQYKSDKSLAQETITHSQGNTIACLGCFPPGMPFYVGRSITLLTKDNGGEIKSNYIPFYLAELSVLPPQIVKQETLARWFAAQKKPVFLLAVDGHIPDLKTFAASHHSQAISLPNGYWGVLVKDHH